MDIAISVDNREVYPNDTIHCTISVLVKGKTKTKRIVASFFGEFLSLYYGSKSTHTNRNVFFTLEKTLWLPDDKKSGNIDPGTFEFKADFVVPDGLMPSFPPASMEGTRFCGRLQYFVKVVATKVIGFEDERAERVFVISKDFISSTTEHRRTGAAPATRNKPAATVSLERSVYKPGEMVNCTVAVDKKDATCKIQDVLLSLRNQCWGWVDGAWCIDDVFRDEYSLGASDQGSKSFSLLLPADAATTLYGGNVKITWDVHLQVNLSLSKDLHLTVPILVGSKGAVVPPDEASRDAVPGRLFCPMCGSPLDPAKTKCESCDSVLENG